MRAPLGSPHGHYMSNMPDKGGEMTFSAVEPGWTCFAHVWREEMSAVCSGDVSELPTPTQTER